jgi:hypothetical protein
MQQALAMIFRLMDGAPGIDMQIAAIHRPSTPDEQMEMIGRVDGIETPASELLELLRRARGANISARAPSNIVIRPDPAADHPWLFLDDLPTSRALDLSRNFVALVVETSRGNCQMRLLADHPLTKGERTQAQTILQQRIQGDPGSVSGEKWGRLPGFTNQKPGKQGQWTNLIWDSAGLAQPLPCGRVLSLAPQGGVCSCLSSLSPASPRPQGGERAGSPRPSAALSSLSPRATINKADCAREALARPLPDANGQQAGWRQEFADACQALRAGLPNAEILSMLASRAIERGKRRTTPEAQKYAEHILSVAQKAQERAA